jgi:hypothetical protein
MSLRSVPYLFSTALDNYAMKVFFEYNFNKNLSSNTKYNTLGSNRLSYKTSYNTHCIDSTHFNYKPLMQTTTVLNKLSFNIFKNIPSYNSLISAESDSKTFSNNFKYMLYPYYKKKALWNLPWINSSLDNSEFTSSTPFNNFPNALLNSENLLKFRDIKSSNLQFLGSEKTVRMLTNLNSNNYSYNIRPSVNYTSLINNQAQDSSFTQNIIYTTSSLNWLDLEKNIRYGGGNITMPITHIPVSSNNQYYTDTSFDFFEKNTDEATPMVLRGKEESAPSHVFSSY